MSRSTKVNSDVVSETDDGIRAPFDVIVGVVTHRRAESVSALLDALDRLEFPGARRPHLGVIVVDNSLGYEARPVVVGGNLKWSFPVEYVAHGAENISSGRNEVLDRAVSRAPFLALIDDDELPAPEWLHELLAAQARTSADVVAGPVEAVYPDTSPDWMKRRAPHAIRGPNSPTWVDEAYTCNALVRTQMVRELGLRFDETLGLSGGEDQLFFRQASMAGAEIYHVPTAIVREPVVPARLTVRYLLRREYRKGSTLGLLDRSRPGWPPGRPLRRAAQSVYWATTGMLTVANGLLSLDQGNAVVGVLRISRATGMLYGLLGQTPDIYAEKKNLQVPRTRIAVVAAEGPTYQNAGHSRHLQGFIRHFCQQGFDVTIVVPGRRTGFFARRTDPAGPMYVAPTLRRVGVWEIILDPLAMAGQAGWTLFRSLPPVIQRMVDRVRSARRDRLAIDHILGDWPSRRMSNWIRAALDRIKPDVVLFNTIFTTPDPFALPVSVRVSAVIAHDVVHERADSLRAAGHRVAPVSFSKADEVTRLRTVDTVIAIHWDDARTLASLVPLARVVVSTVAVEAIAHAKGEAVPGRCVFVGSGSLHNVEAITWLLRECWPEVVRRRPGSELHIIGTVCARIAGDVPDGAVLRGEVDDLGEEYRAAQVAVAPLRSGSGLKVKVVEAICYGVATVTTAVGAQGLTHLEPQPYRSADGAGSFVQAIIDLLEDEMARRDLECAAMEVAPLFSEARVYEDLDRRLAEAGVVSPIGAAGGNA